MTKPIWIDRVRILSEFVSNARCCISQCRKTSQKISLALLSGCRESVCLAWCLRGGPGAIIAVCRWMVMADVRRPSCLIGLQHFSAPIYLTAPFRRRHTADIQSCHSFLWWHQVPSDLQNDEPKTDNFAQFSSKLWRTRRGGDDRTCRQNLNLNGRFLC